ncbi:MAG TPA: hypothetical protein P5080_05030 [Candidatus Paceibacterota bacterium]|nr:hypothetical protein [Candidatus Pacearchaeota archaeon]HRZ51312.1 hypothetical protein [Candidatus Paceibacterota bacterium]HSA37034.1 hypothetical protein [Candidatus Paceibacterota bacterium]
MDVLISKKDRQEKGFIVFYVLIFGAVFLVLIGALFGLILMQLRHSAQKVSWNQSLNIAEAGVEYYRWCLNHGVEAGCSGTKDYLDNNGNSIGKFTIDSDSAEMCGQVIQRTITSVGWTNNYPSSKRTIRVLYAKDSIAKYSYILNSNVWIGDDHIINGPYHSNGGIRMDGSNQSLISSAAVRNNAGEWICTSSFGCNPCPTGDGCYTSGGNCICPGVFTTTDNPTVSLFKYPTPPFDFNAITIDLAMIKDKAQNGGGLYFPKSVDLVPGSKGYHLKFLSNGRVEVWAVRALQQTNGYSEEEGWQQDRFTINNESLYGTYSIPADCSVIYLEDNLWVEGTVKGKVVVASADLININVDTSIVLPSNITYSTYSGSDGLALIAEKNVLIGPQSPNNMELHTIIVAQKGRFGRNHYPNNFRDSLTIYGSIISNGRVGTQWTSGSQIVSGYTNRYTYYDRNQVYNPPPFIASTSSDFKIVRWQEID